MVSDAHDFVVGFFEGTCFFRDVTFDDTDDFPGIDGNIVVADAVVRRMDIHHLTVVPHLTRFPSVVQVARIRIMKLVMLDDDALGNTGNGSDNAAGRSQISLADVVTLFHIADFDNSPIHLTIEAATKTLRHMSKVHILIFHLTQVRMSTEVFIRREWGTETQSMSGSHIAFHTLAR